MLVARAKTGEEGPTPGSQSRKENKTMGLRAAAVRLPVEFQAP